MSDAVLVLNAGSSSVKFALFTTTGHILGPKEICRGQVSGLPDAPRFKILDAASSKTHETALEPVTAGAHGFALSGILARLNQNYPSATIRSVGHRIVHGGVDFADPIILNEAIEARLTALVPLAPLHQPHNLAGVRAARAAFPQAPQIACFDTAFHRAHPWVNDTFALPNEFYDEGVRRYGFHGLSYEYVSSRLAEIAPDLAAGKVVVAHLGNGASMCAIKNGQSVGSTMGFTALDGLPMGTRCGQLDPGVLLYLMQEKGMDADALTDLLYTRSGLKGLSGLSHDMRVLEASDDPHAARAIDYFVFRIKRELGAMAAVLEGLDALVFTGGIGEKSALIRERVTAGMDWLDLAIDTTRNAANETDISAPASRCRTLVIATDEERVIARHTAQLSGQGWN